VPALAARLSLPSIKREHRLVTTGARLTLAGLLVAAIAVVVGTTMVPTHVTFGAGSLRCGTVLHPDSSSEIALLCGPAGAHHLRAALIVGGILAVIAFVPLVVEWRRPGQHRGLWAGWAMVLAVATGVAVAGLGFFVEYAPKSVFFDL